MDAAGAAAAAPTHRPSTQFLDAHSSGVTHAPPIGTLVLVGVAVAVAVAVEVAVAVAVAVEMGPTLTVKVQMLVLFATSTHVHVTVVIPSGKVLPDGGTQSRLLTPPASLQLAT